MTLAWRGLLVLGLGAAAANHGLGVVLGSAALGVAITVEFMSDISRLSEKLKKK